MDRQYNSELPPELPTTIGQSPFTAEPLVGMGDETRSYLFLNYDCQQYQCVE